MTSLKELLLRLRFSIRHRTLKPIAADSSNALVACGKSIINRIPERCPHQGAPLKNSYLNGDFLACHWHGCLFSLKEQKWIRSPECHNKVEDL
jgi:nitrite reductase/ring-hydroxylating ferredoxin subunit